MKHSVRASRSRLTGFYLAVLALLCLLPFLVHAAEVTATISGTVNDSTGAVVPKATVTLTNTGTNVARTVVTDSSGSYLFTLVPIGGYRLTVEQTGFRKYVRDGIVLNVNQNAKLDVVLQVGAASQVVEVTGDLTQVDTVSATLGNVETERRIVDLPLVERDAFQLGLLQAGVFPPDEGLTPEANQSCGSVCARARKVVRWLRGWRPGPPGPNISSLQPTAAGRQHSADRLSARAACDRAWEESKL